MKKIMYTTKATSVGLGRSGSTITISDNSHNIKIGHPKELGGTGLDFNPEQLFAAGYSACMQGAIVHVVNSKKIGKNPDSVTALVSLGTRNDVGFTISVAITVTFKDLDLETAKELVKIAHEDVCPYSYILKDGAAKVQIEVISN